MEQKNYFRFSSRLYFHINKVWNMIYTNIPFQYAYVKTMCEVTWTFRTFHYMKIILSLPNISLHKNILSKSQVATSLEKTLGHVQYGEFYEISKTQKDLPTLTWTTTAAVSKFGKILAYYKIKINMLSNLWWRHHCSDHCSDGDIVKNFSHKKRWKAVLINAHHNPLVVPQPTFILYPKQMYLYTEWLYQIWNDSCLSF